MAKLNLTVVLNQFAEEIANEKTAAKAAHPYYGISDGKGWLTRYPYPQESSSDSCFLDPEWVREYVAAGGGFDSNGHRGLSPYNSSYSPRKVEETDPIQYGRWVKLTGRGDGHFGQQYWNMEVEENDVYCLSNSVEDFLRSWTISDTCDLRTLATAYRGHLIFRVLESVGIPVSSNSFLSLGRWSQEKVDKMVLARAVPSTPEMWRRFAYGLARTEFSGLPLQISPALDRAYACGLKHARRNELDHLVYIAEESRRNTRSKFSSIRAVNIYNKKGGHTNRLSRTWMPDQYACISTNAGSFKEFRDGTIGLLGDRYAFSAIEVVPVEDGISTSTVCTYGRTYHFAWITAQGFRASHIESRDSMGDALRKLSKRKRFHSGSISLNDVRNDVSGTLGYCISGSKSFLQRAMPHIYNLISPYSSWKDVPAEIMEIEWTLDNPKGLFEGSDRNPFA